MIHLKNIFLANLDMSQSRNRLDVSSDEEILISVRDGLLTLPPAAGQVCNIKRIFRENAWSKCRLKAEQARHQEYPVFEQDLLENPWSKSLISLLIVGFFHHMPDLMRLSLFHQHLRENGQLFTC